MGSFRSVAVGIALCAGAVACTDAVGPIQYRDLETARQRWQAQNLHTYAFTVKRECFCANVDRLYVLVVGDSVAGVFDLDTGQQAALRLGTTVDALFTFVQQAIDRHVDVIDAQYDAVKGYPIEIRYDGSVQGADDELLVHVSDVHPIDVTLSASAGLRNQACLFLSSHAIGCQSSTLLPSGSTIHANLPFSCDSGPPTICTSLRRRSASISSRSSTR